MARSHRALALLFQLGFLQSMNLYSHRALALAAMLMLQSEFEHLALALLLTLTLCVNVP